MDLQNTTTKRITAWRINKTSKINKSVTNVKAQTMYTKSVKNLIKVSFFSWIVLISLMAKSHAADNSIYVQQSGNNTTVTMDQNGSGNVIRDIQGVGTGNTTPANITGNSNTVTVNQLGTGNTMNMGIDTTIAEGGTFGGNFSYTVNGNNSTATIDSNNDSRNSSQSNSVTITQTGNNSNANMNVLGNLNTITATTTGGNSNSFISAVNGNNNTQTVSVSGGGNNIVEINQGVGGTAANNTVLNLGTIGLTTYNYGGAATVTVQGASNNINVQQTGITGFTNTTTFTVNGSSNTANVVQSAVAGNTTVNVTSSGSSNIFTITSKNF